MIYIAMIIIFVLSLIVFSGIDTFDAFQSVPKPYKSTDPIELYRFNDLMANMINTRQPCLMKQRYSYDDKKICSKLPVIPNVARLGELPLQLRNWYSATVPYELTLYDDYNQPSDTIGNRYDGQCKLSNFQYDSKRPIYPYQISGYSPNDFLPAQQADRSKISIDKYMASGFWIQV